MQLYMLLCRSHRGFLINKFGGRELGLTLRFSYFKSLVQRFRFFGAFLLQLTNQQTQYYFMHILSSPLSRIKARSQSMPLLPQIPRSIQPIHKIRKNKVQSAQNTQNLLPFIQLQAIKDKSGEQLDSKIKAIQKRNMKKLEERYDTIDRWKEKYIPESSVLLIRQKMNVQNTFPSFQPRSQLHKSSPISLHGLVNKSQKLMPISHPKTLDLQLPDHRELSRRLQIELMNRLQRNKKYYEKGNLVYALKCYQNKQDQNFDNRVKKYKIIHHSSPLSERQSPDQPKKVQFFPYYAQANLLKSAIIKYNGDQQKTTSNPEEEKAQVISGIKMKKAKRIAQLKQGFLKQTSQQIPQGWSVENQLSPFAEQDVQ